MESEKRQPRPGGGWESFRRQGLCEKEQLSIQPVEGQQSGPMEEERGRGTRNMLTQLRGLLRRAYSQRLGKATCWNKTREGVAKDSGLDLEGIGGHESLEQKRGSRGHRSR